MLIKDSARDVRTRGPMGEEGPFRARSRFSGSHVGVICLVFLRFSPNPLAAVQSIR
jgi:hypothetical protein